MPYDIADLKNIQIEIRRKVSTMASTADNVDYSFSNDEKLIIYNKNSENKITEENNDDKQGPSSQTNKGTSIDIHENNLDTSQENCPVNLNDAITKMECKLKDLKKQRDGLPEVKRIIRDESKKRSRPQTKKEPSIPRRYDSSSDSSRSVPDRSPSPKRTRTESPRRNYDSDSYRESSLSSLNSDRSYSCVSKKLKKELSSFLGNSFVSINGQQRSRKPRRERSRSPRRSDSNERSRYSRRASYDRSRYSRRGYSHDKSRSRRDEDDYDRNSKRKSRRQTERNSNYNRNYQQWSSNDIEERYSRYYAVMYAFSIIMDILRQDDIYSTF